MEPKTIGRSATVSPSILLAAIRQLGCALAGIRCIQATWARIFAPRRRSCPKFESSQTLYLELMKRCLTNLIYQNDSNFNADRRLQGRDWPSVAHTMIGLQRLNNLQFCIEEALRRRIPGDLIEAGVWRGGASIFMRAVLKAHRVTNRKVWVADSFQGLPPPKPDIYPCDKGDIHHTYKQLAISLEEVKLNFERYGLLDRQVAFLKGWFCDSLPFLPVRKWAVIRLDGDMYESTMDGLINLYPDLSRGGYIIIDDFGAIESCRRAVLDFRRIHRISEKIQPVDWTGVYWQRR